MLFQVTNSNLGTRKLELKCRRDVGTVVQVDLETEPVDAMVHTLCTLMIDFRSSHTVDSSDK